MTTITIEQAYEKGWIAASKWAKRDDLVADIGSQAYVNERNLALAAPATAPELVGWPSPISIAALAKEVWGNPIPKEAYVFANLLKTALRTAFAAPATAPDTSESVVWKATSISGDTAHFGARSAAKAWARSGTVEAVPLRNLRLVPKPDAPCKTCESLARAVMMDQVSNDYAPSWHDAPTVPGLWVCREATTGNMQAFVVTDPDALNRNLDIDGRWYGPILEDKQ